MFAIVENFAQLITTPPDPVFAAERVGGRRPSTRGDLPAAVLSLTIDDQGTTGLGRVTRWGDLLTRTSSIVDVATTPNTFSSDLRHLRLSPLPLRKNPRSLGGDFTAEDVQVTNVSDAAHPVEYRLTREPREQHEFAIEAAPARLTFGLSQTSGDKLEVVHWTVTWRDDIEGSAFRGLMDVEIWASSFLEVATASQRLQERLVAQRALMRGLGFCRLQGAGLHAAEQVLHTPAIDSPFQVWRQLLTYRFAFELERPAQDSGAGSIRRINVEIDHELNDRFGIPGPNA